MSEARTDFWWDAEEGRVHEKVFAYVSAVDQNQADLFQRFLKCAVLYDPNDQCGFRNAAWLEDPSPGAAPDSAVSENICATNVDSFMALAASSEPRVRFMTDGADWSARRRAKQLERYANALIKLLEIHEYEQGKCKGGTIKGTGLVKVYRDPVSDDVRLEVTPVDELVVDDGELRGTHPRQLHQRMVVSREVLKAAFPDFAAEIDKAQTSTNAYEAASWAWWVDSYGLERDQIIVIESWKLPIGDEPGLRTMCIDGADLVREKWTKPRPPFSVFRFSERERSFYGIGMVERLAGRQRAINKLNWQEDRILDQFAFPTTWVKMADANLVVKTINRFGTLGIVKNEYPQTVTPNPVSPQMTSRRRELVTGSYEETGMNRMTSTGSVPAGFESGEAIRQFHDKTSLRFAPQEKARERSFLDTVFLVLDLCKDLGEKAPRVNGVDPPDWSKVDMTEVRAQMTTASALAKTPAGRIAFAGELAGQGLITSDEYRTILDHPDVDGVLSLYVAAYEDVERCIEEIFEGATLTPEPYQNLKMIVWRGQHHYLKAQNEGAPEEDLERLRQWVVIAAHMLSLAEPANEMPQPGAPPVMAPAAPAVLPPAAAA